MAARGNVRTHTRRTASGKTATVHQRSITISGSAIGKGATVINK